MPSRVLVISGLPASGKTTLAESLAVYLSLPLVTKDDYKGILLRHLPTLPNTQAGPLSFSLMWHVAEMELRAGVDFILETHFYRPQSEDILNGLSAQHGAKLAQIFCHAPLDELRKRHAARVESGKRPGIDLPFDHADLPLTACWEPMNLNDAPLLRLDTTGAGAEAEALKWVQERF